MMFKVTTAEGVTVYTGGEWGMTETAAQSSADERNRRAEKLGIKTRYEIRLV